MKKLLLLAIFSVFFLWHGQASASIVFVASSSVFSGGNQTTVTSTVSATTGNTLILGIGFNTNVTVNSVSDGVNTYTRDVISTNGANAGIEIWRAANITGGTLNITATLNGTGRPAMSIHEFSGVLNTSPIDTTSTAQGTSNAPNAGNVTTAANGELVFMNIYRNGDINDGFTPGAGFTLMTNLAVPVAGRLIASEYKIPVAGTYATDGTLAVNDGSPWAAAGLSYKAAASAPAVAKKRRQNVVTVIQ